jgi:hypothetical protein
MEGAGRKYLIVDATEYTAGGVQVGLGCSRYVSAENLMNNFTLKPLTPGGVMEPCGVIE